MKLRFSFAALLILLSVVSLSAATPQYGKIDYKVRDLALIYQGGAHRIGWVEREIEPYVTHVFADGTEEWLFDGYLFLEFTNGSAVDPGWFAPGTPYRNANKADWEYYMGRLFQKGRGLDALDKVISKKKKTLGDPGFKHKISLTTLIPIKGQTDWGELNGKQMDFNQPQDRYDAGEWFTNEIVKKFYEQNYENLELFAIYMLAEDMHGIETYIRKFGKYVKNTLGLDYIWIPYFKAFGSKLWKDFSMDCAYHQPNHYFDASIPDSRLDEAVAYSKEYGLGMEFECDEESITQAAYCRQSRMVTYMNRFEKLGVWKNMPVAYYTGNHALLDFHNHPGGTNTEVVDRLCRYIVERRNANTESGVEVITTTEETTPVYYNLQGMPVANPSNGIYIEKCGDKTRKVVF